MMPDRSSTLQPAVGTSSGLQQPCSGQLSKVLSSQLYGRVFCRASNQKQRPGNTKDASIGDAHTLAGDPIHEVRGEDEVSEVQRPLRYSKVAAPSRAAE